MSLVILLDSGPLGLLVHRRGLPDADACRSWMASHVLKGNRVIVPAIIDYELRRELLRMAKANAIHRLDSLISAVPGRFLELTTVGLRRAAELWAESRRAGLPTASSDALDVDVILAAQALGLGLASNEFMVATTNATHLTRFVPAAEWRSI